MAIKIALLSLAGVSEIFHLHILLFVISLLLLILVLYTSSISPKPIGGDTKPTYSFSSYLRFFYASFLKPHACGGCETGQQDALESFYAPQARIYDQTRKKLLRGREDMLNLVAAQLKFRAEKVGGGERRIWVDIGGGTGYNIEAMASFLPVKEFFSAIYLVDLSPSLCEVARLRFRRLGWDHVKVICKDARVFHLEDYEADAVIRNGTIRQAQSPYGSFRDGISRRTGGAHLVTLSYSLSMIPDYYSVIDALPTLLSPEGILGVTDFYVQSNVDLAGRNYTGGTLNRHVNWLSRVFWRAWFEVDRVGLEPGRRDYLEYRFGTILSVDDRNYMLGGIPFYIWIGCPKTSPSPHAIERLATAVAEPPHLSLRTRNSIHTAAIPSPPLTPRSKLLNPALLHLLSTLPLPSSFYQNTPYRAHYPDHVSKHLQLPKSYIYAFTWEDPASDQSILSLTSGDTVLALTSGGDNILSYLLEGVQQIHAVDINPAQGHLLELKVTAFTTLTYPNVWRLFGEGRHPQFRELLVGRLSPYLSSRAFQFWWENAGVFTSKGGLYESGGSGFAVRLVRWTFTALGLSGEVKRLCEARTLSGQRAIWRGGLRRVLLSWWVSWAVVGNEWFLWRALGVPREQREMILRDYQEQVGDRDGMEARGGSASGKAIWEYVVNTLDPVVENSLVSEDNYFYLLCLQGKYSRRCHPPYLTPKAHLKISHPNVFSGLHIHTDEVCEVVSRLTPSTLTVAVIMDSMDWFSPSSPAAAHQITAINLALAPRGRVLLRSAALKPWYIAEFEARGFEARRVAARIAGACIDRVNMYASTWLLTKISTVDIPASDCVEAATRPSVSHPDGG